jgi:twinkle protein
MISISTGLFDAPSGCKFKKETDLTDFQSIYEHIHDNFFYIINESDFTIESVIKSAQSYVKQKGIKILVVDPYNKLDHQMKGEIETQYISRFLDVLVNFARFNNVLVFLVAPLQNFKKVKYLLYILSLVQPTSIIKPIMDLRFIEN